MRVLVTGASGFVGQALCAYLREGGAQVRRALRRATPEDESDDDIVIGEIGPDTDWKTALEGVEAIVHLAARVHIMRDTVSDPFEQYRQVNVQGTRWLAQAAATAGVRRFVFLSSIKVNGENTVRPFSEADVPQPADAYGISKWEAEQALMQIARETSMGCVVLRPPLLYGRGVGANFLSLMRAVDRRIPLPLGALKNKRSLLYLGNLIDAIRMSLSHPRAPGEVFLLSDGEDVSTPELVCRLAAALGVRPRLFHVPARVLRLGARVAGRAASAERLTGSLQVDSSRIRAILGWRPPFSLNQGLTETAHWYRQVVKKRC